MTDRHLCTLSALDVTRAKGLTVEIGGKANDIFLVRSAAGSIHAYIDRCPHRGSPLAWREDDYLDEDGEFIMCATHAALFRIEDGACMGGPCRGAGLTALAVHVDGNEIYLDDPCTG